ncbi:MAG: S1C family serine protease, partial [Dehalococcoidia bacterium]
MNRFLAPAAAIIATLALTASACSDRVPGSLPPSPGQSSASSTPSAASGSAATSEATRAPVATAVSKTNELSTADLVKLAEPSIVRIDTTAGIGTGFFVSEDGYIVTNAHVVAGRNGATQTTVGVTLSDGTRVEGTVVGVETIRFDVAIIKVGGGPFKALPFANLENVLVGQDVVAIGYALDLKGGEGPAFTVTRGIVSAKNRSTTEDPRAQSFGAIQTDAAITHGNSGGPLLNLNGEVVGVNTSIAPDPATGGVAAGIGFALGSDVVKAVYDDVRADGKVTRGYLGIGSFEALRPAKAREL